MSPLGEAIYSILVERVGLKSPLITYDKLVKSLPPLDPPHNDITRNDERLYRALGEVGQGCREQSLPTVTALVIRSSEQSPGSGYYYQFHPETGNDPVRQREAWERELERLKTASYPPILKGPSRVTLNEASDDRQDSTLLGTLRIADGAQASTTLFSGHVTCPYCSISLDIDVARNPKAVSPKQPAFVINETGKAPRNQAVGHLFIGTILNSPVLYFGSLNHCGSEQRVALFFNQAMRDRSDHHLAIMKSTSG